MPLLHTTKVPSEVAIPLDQQIYGHLRTAPLCSLRVRTCSACTTSTTQSSRSPKPGAFSGVLSAAFNFSRFLYL